MEVEQPSDQEIAGTEEEKPKGMTRKESVLLALEIIFIILVYSVLILVIPWPVSIKAGFVFVGSASLLLWAAYYSRASILHGHEEKPVVWNLGLMGTLIAVYGGEAIFHALHSPPWLPLLYGFSIVFLILLITCLLQAHWRRLRRKRHLLEELDPETMLANANDAEEERYVLFLLLYVIGCFLIAAGIVVTLYYLNISVGWAAILTGSLSVGLIVWGEYNLRAHLLYGYRKKRGTGWAVFLGVMIIYISMTLYFSTFFDSQSLKTLATFVPVLAMLGQYRLSRRWNIKGEQLRQVIRPDTDVQAMLEERTDAPIAFDKDEAG